MAAREVGASGRVVGVDLSALDPPLELPNVITLELDLTDDATSAAILHALGGGPANVVLCDAAPKLTGVRATDRAREEALLEAVERLLPTILRPGGDWVQKLLDSPEAQRVARRIRERFARTKVTRPQATRRGSTEAYLIARQFQG